MIARILPYLLAGYFFTVGQIVDGGLVIALTFLISGFLAKNLTRDKIANLTFLSPLEREKLRQMHKSWGKKQRWVLHGLLLLLCIGFAKIIAIGFIKVGALAFNLKLNQ